MLQLKCGIGGIPDPAERVILDAWLLMWARFIVQLSQGLQLRLQRIVLLA